jgi:hypothetical protein
VPANARSAARIRLLASLRKALVLGGLAGRYDYRIWTWRARRLLFFIIF